MDVESFRLFVERFGYLFLFIGSFADGLHALLLGGFVVALGYLDPLPSYIALFLGDFLSDIAWFYGAYFGGTHLVAWVSKFHKDIPRHINKAKGLLEKYPGRILFLGKLTFGIAIATLIAAGLSKMSQKKFLAVDFLGNLIMVFGVMALGYLFGESYEAISNYFRTLGIILLVLLVAGVIIWTYWSRQRQERDY